MPDDGYGEFGGGGSVHWEIDVNDGDLPATNPKDPENTRKYKTSAKDRKGIDDSANYILVEIRNPELVKVAGDVVTYAVRISKNKEVQVKVKWAYGKGDQAMANMKGYTRSAV
jgi:hypothetical protein